MLNKLTTGIIGVCPEDDMVEYHHLSISTDAAASQSRVLPEVVVLTSYPPRECGIATYAHDLVAALDRQFEQSFSISICAIEPENEKYDYDKIVQGFVRTGDAESFISAANAINANPNVCLVLIQHEFGFFENCESALLDFMDTLIKPVVVSFHTVLPHPNEDLRNKVRSIGDLSGSLIVMTQNSAKILAEDYGIPGEKITVIPHGTHLVNYPDKELLKLKYGLSGRTILSTFGLLSSGKSIETTLEALPDICREFPDVLFLVIGKTHPSVAKREGEAYRTMLEAKVEALDLGKHVRFINSFLPLPVLLEYLQLTDVYLFTSKDPNQAVSGTFSYAISSGCPVISTPIPHAREVLKDDAGIIFDFCDSGQLCREVIALLHNKDHQSRIALNALHRMASTAWENSAIAHATLFKKNTQNDLLLNFTLPPVNLSHIWRMTTNVGMIQFAILDQPDLDSGYTLDDNARALVALCQFVELSSDKRTVLPLLTRYLNFIAFCQQPTGEFLNYVDKDSRFTDQNKEENLDDSNGRAVWALGYFISMHDFLPADLVAKAELIFERAWRHLSSIQSARAVAFVMKGIYLYSKRNKASKCLSLLNTLANRLVQMYRNEANDNWRWFEGYLTYANSILPEALVYAWFATGRLIYRQVAITSFSFLLSKTFDSDAIKLVSNRGWLHKNRESERESHVGEQPIDVAYTILSLVQFSDSFNSEDFRNKIYSSFDWFLGKNHLHQIIYNPHTGGCYDGLEGSYVNLNQGAESTLSYLMARLAIEKHKRNYKRQGILAFGDNKDSGLSWKNNNGSYL